MSCGARDGSFSIGLLPASISCCNRVRWGWERASLWVEGVLVFNLCVADWFVGSWFWRTVVTACLTAVFWILVSRLVTVLDLGTCWLVWD